MPWRPGIALLLGLAALLHARGAPAVTLGVVSDFEIGAQGWISGRPNPNDPVLEADGGPQGTGDAFLRVTATGVTGAGGKLVCFNTTPAWTGNYTSAGVAVIEMDLKNLTEAMLQIRIEVGPTRIGASGVSLFAAELAPFQDWTHVRIPIDAAALSGSNPVAALAQVQQIRIMHNPMATESTFAPPIDAELGIDNVRAAPVPEPSTLALVAAGLAALAAGHRSPRADSSGVVRTRRSAPSARPPPPAWRGRPRSRPRAACAA